MAAAALPFSPFTGCLHKAGASLAGVPMRLYTLLFVRDSGRILLGLKKRGFGRGRWNGFGGKVDAGETVDAAAARELLEESGVTAAAVSHEAVIHFAFMGKEEMLEVHVYTAPEWSGEPVESEEMRPAWFAEADVPYKDMWADDEAWLPLLLAGKPFYAQFLFDGMSDIVASDLYELDRPAAAAAIARGDIAADMAAYAAYDRSSRRYEPPKGKPMTTAVGEELDEAAAKAEAAEE